MGHDGHAAERRPHDRKQAGDAQLLHGGLPGTSDVRNMQQREAGAIRLAGGRRDGGGAGAAEAAAQRIHADDEQLVRVQRLAGAQLFFPPAGSRVADVAGGMGADGQTREHQHGIVAGSVQGAPGFHGNRGVYQFSATLQAKR